MKSILALLILLLTALPAYADQPEAKEVARINNCPPKKVEVFKNSVGKDAKTVYQITCNLPKTTDKDSTGMPDSLLVACDQSLCELMRPVAAEKK